MPDPIFLNARQAAARLGFKRHDHRSLPELRDAYHARSITVAIQFGGRWRYYAAKIEQIKTGEI